MPVVIQSRTFARLSDRHVLNNSRRGSRHLATAAAEDRIQEIRSRWHHATVQNGYAYAGPANAVRPGCGRCHGRRIGGQQLCVGQRIIDTRQGVHRRIIGNTGDVRILRQLIQFTCWHVGRDDIGKLELVAYLTPMRLFACPASRALVLHQHMNGAAGLTRSDVTNRLIDVRAARPLLVRRSDSRGGRQRYTEQRQPNQHDGGKFLHIQQGTSSENYRHRDRL